MRRTLVLILSALALFALVAPAAHADVGYATVFFADINQAGKVTTINGQLDCTAGETFGLRVNIRQDEANAVGRLTGDCSSVAYWATSVERTIEGTFECGWAEGHGQVRLSDGSRRSFHGDVQVRS